MDILLWDVSCNSGTWIFQRYLKTGIPFLPLGKISTVWHMAGFKRQTDWENTKAKFLDVSVLYHGPICQDWKGLAKICSSKDEEWNEKDKIGNLCDECVW